MLQSGIPEPIWQGRYPGGKPGDELQGRYTVRNIFTEEGPNMQCQRSSRKGTVPKLDGWIDGLSWSLGPECRKGDQLQGAVWKCGYSL